MVGLELCQTDGQILQTLLEKKDKNQAYNSKYSKHFRLNLTLKAKSLKTFKKNHLSAKLF